MRFIPALLFFAFLACSSLPEPKHSKFSFPEKAVFVNLPTDENKGRPYAVLGWVRTRAVYPTMDQDENNSGLCHNYYNKAARSLLKDAKKVGADAVVEVRSVVLLLDGKTEEHETPQCSDDGAQGEILLRGIAVKYKPWPTPTPTPVPVGE